MNDVKFKAGDVVERADNPGSWMRLKAEMAADLNERNNVGWRLKDRPAEGARVQCHFCSMQPLVADAQSHHGWHISRGDVIPPAERQLAPGWFKTNDGVPPWRDEGRCICTHSHQCQEGATYVTRDEFERSYAKRGSCEKHAEADGVFIPAPKVEAKPSAGAGEREIIACSPDCLCHNAAKPCAPVCKDACGRYTLQTKDVAHHAWGQGFYKPRETDPSTPIFCSRECRDAGRPLNPAVPSRFVEAQANVGPVRPATPEEVEAFRRFQDVKPRTVGTYGKTPRHEGGDYNGMCNEDQLGATATLIANLAREKPPRREIKIPRRYLPGANLDE